jgi:HemX protein
MNYVLFLVLGAAGYLLASVFYCAYMLKTKHREQIAFLHAGRLAGVLAIVFQTTAIGIRCVHLHHTPISTGPEAFSATAWAITVLYFGLEIFNWKKPPAAIGAVAFPLAFLSMFTGSTLSSKQTPMSSGHIRLLDSSLVSLHILAIIFSFGLLTLAVSCSLLYLIEHRLLKQKRFGGPLFRKLPPLATVDHLAFSLVCLAFPLLSLGIIAGCIRALSFPSPVYLWAFDPPTFAAFACWAIYGFYLWAHATANWQGIRANYLILAGLIIVIITFFVPSHLHRFS